jgi:ParB family transcriptional regulator, chromosome partitioning protein
MGQPAKSEPRGRVTGLQERRLGKTLLRTYRTEVDIDRLEPNERQPRIGSKEDPELQRQIEANEGIFEPLLVEPHPEHEDKFRIIDGERRWTNSEVLVNAGREQFRRVPVEVTDRTLSDEERLRAWIYIHRQRKEWDAREKEMVAYRLVQLVGRASAANILGITVRELDKLVAIFELSERFDNLRDPSAAITWARELMGVSKNLLTPSVVDAVVAKVNQKRITNSKDLRKLRTILRDPVAKANFLSDEGAIDTAMLRLTPKAPRGPGVLDQLDTAMDAIRNAAWTDILDLQSDRSAVQRIEEAEKLLQTLKANLTMHREGA